MYKYQEVLGELTIAENREEGVHCMNKTALIVGGSGGIGSCLVQQFYEAGYQVIFTYHKNKEAARMLENQYGAVPYQLDPTHEESVEKIKVYLASNYSS